MIVMKFGGTSVGGAEAIARTVEIVRGRLGRRPVVAVSAMSKVTDSLLRLADLSAAGDEAGVRELLGHLERRHVETARELLAGSAEPAGPEFAFAAVERRIHEALARLDALSLGVRTLGELTARSRDAFASFGERLSSLLVVARMRAVGLPAELVDAAGLVATDETFMAARPDLEHTTRLARARLLPLLEAGRLPVTQGFLGATRAGVTTTLGRGGSDYSGAILGAALGAERIEIWTDVDGMLTTDPRVVPGALRIREISFAEAAELAYFGAKVLHPNTVLPAVERDIPVHIYNTHNPACEGTRITGRGRPTGNVVKSIAFKRGITVVRVTSTRMLLAHGFLRAIFEVFERHRTSVDVVTTSEVSVSATIDDTSALEAIRADLTGIGGVEVESGMAIVCVVGEGLRTTPGVAARVFAALAPANVRLISQGGSEINLTFVIREEDAHDVVRRLHGEFFREADPEVFAN